MNTTSTLEAGLGKRSVFERLFDLIDKHDEKIAQDRLALDDFYDIVTSFDNAFQKFNSAEGNNFNITLYNSLLTDTFEAFILIFNIRGFRNEAFFYAFKRFIVYFTLILKEADRQKEKDIVNNFFENFPSINIKYISLTDSKHYFYHLEEMFALDEYDLLNQDGGDLPRIPMEMLFLFKNFPTEIGIKDRYKELPIYCNNFEIKHILWQFDESKYEIVKEYFYMRLEIEVDSENISTSKLLGPIYLIVSALENIKGNTVELIDISKGSVKADIKILMKDLVAKEETKVVIETAKEAVVAALTAGTVSYSEVKKNRKETQNAELEHEKLLREVEQMPSTEEAKHDRALDTERKDLENEKLRLENIKARLDIIETLSGLVAKGMLSADMLEININGVLLLLKDKKEIKEIGPDIEDIT